MHSTVRQSAIATKTEKIKQRVVQTPQRKANYKQKERFRLKDLKEKAFTEYKVSTTGQIKKYLKMLGVSLDLRLTAAWDAVVFELRKNILAFVDKASAFIKQVMPPSDSDRLLTALSSGVIADFREDEIGGIYWVWSKAGIRELVTSSNLCRFLRQIAA